MNGLRPNELAVASGGAGKRQLDLVSIIAPAYNEEEVLPEFVRRIAEVMDGAGLPFEIVFVNDGSTDGTLATMHALKVNETRIAIVNLSRNFGKEVAMTAGIAHGHGDVQVIIDTDLQDPPELIPILVEKWHAGADVVYAQREFREGESWLKKATAGWFYSLIRNVGPVPLPENVGDFRLISKRVAEALLLLPERHRFMKGLYAWVGFPQTKVTYVRHPRFAGKTKWNYWRLWNLAIEGITSFTIAPLKVATYLGFAVAALAFFFAIVVIAKTIMLGDPVAGYPSLMVAIVMFGGLQFIVLGIMGEYLGRIFNEAKGRPLYLIESVAPSVQPADGS